MKNANKTIVFPPGLRVLIGCAALAAGMAAVAQTQTAPTRAMPMPKLNLKPLPAKEASSTEISRQQKRTSRTADPTPKEEITPDGQYCSSRQVSEEKGDLEKIVLTNQNDKIFPGAIYKISSLLDGSYNATQGLQLKPYRIATSLVSGASQGLPYVDVQPTYGDVAKGISTLIKSNRNVVNSAMMNIQARTLYSQEQLKFELQAGYGGFGYEVEAMFKSQSKTSKRVVFAKLTQEYFSVILDSQSNVSSALLSNPPASLDPNLVYVHKVKYGRIGIVKVETDSSESEIQAALQAAYSGAELKANVGHGAVLSNSKIDTFFFGGDARDSVTGLSGERALAEFSRYAKAGLRFNPDVAPTPISYEIKFVNDNATAAVNSATSYPERDCQPGKGVVVRLDGISIDEVHGGDCSYAWGAVDVQIEERRNGVSVKTVSPIENGKALAPGAKTMWSRGKQSPLQGVTNYAHIKNKQAASPINNIGKEWTFLLDPRVQAENRYYIKVTSLIKTNHKDNDFASLGEHGMPGAEVASEVLKDTLFDQKRAGTDHKYGSYVVGPYSSNTNRLHNFRAHFTVTPAQ